MKFGSKSPWGAVQHFQTITEGVELVSTAGHGGLKVARAQNARIPAPLRRAGGWYEEDAEASIVLWALYDASIAETFGASRDRHAETVRAYYPDAWTAATGEPVTREQSRIVAQREDEARFAGRIVARSAWGSSHAKVPAGCVGVWATPVGGGVNAGSYWLADDSRYRREVAECSLGYLIDPLVDRPWTGPHA